MYQPIELASPEERAVMIAKKEHAHKFFLQMERNIFDKIGTYCSATTSNVPCSGWLSMLPIQASSMLNNAVTYKRTGDCY
jgi:hypothetical protein